MSPFRTVYGGLLLAGLSIPLIQRRVKPNGFYGFRTPKTLGDEGVWYAANEYSGRMLLRAGAAMMLAPVALALVPGLSKETRALAGDAAAGVSLLWATAQSFRYLKTL